MQSADEMPIATGGRRPWTIARGPSCRHAGDIGACSCAVEGIPNGGEVLILTNRSIACGPSVGVGSSWPWRKVTNTRSNPGTDAAFAIEGGQRT